MRALPAGGYAEAANLGSLAGTPIDELGTKTGTKGQLRGRSVSIRSDVIIPFLQSLTPFYQLPTDCDKSVAFDSVTYASKPVELTRQSNFSLFCLGCGVVAKLVGAAVPHAEVVAGMTSAVCLTACSVSDKVMQYVRGETAGLSRPMTQGGLSTGALAAASIITLSQLPISAARPVSTQLTDRPTRNVGNYSSSPALTVSSEINAGVTPELATGVSVTSSPAFNAGHVTAPTSSNTTIAMTHWTSWPTISTTPEPFVDSIGGEIMGWTLVAVALVGLGVSAYCFVRQFCGEYVEQVVNAYGDNQERLGYLISDRWRAINYGAVTPIF